MGNHVTATTPQSRTMNVLELYSGIGGMHYAFKGSGIAGKIVAAFDINTTANNVYQHNFPHVKLQNRNIQSLTAEELNAYGIDMILMSPPCQPFTRVGLKKDVSDSRTCSLLHLLTVFPQLDTRWKYMLVENVKGFENSDTCKLLLDMLHKIDFCWQQLILSPSMFSVPNTRHRYYLIAKRRPLRLNFTVELSIMENLPKCQEKAVCEKILAVNSKYKSLADEHDNTGLEKTCYAINLILEADKPTEYFEQFLIADKTLLKHAWLLDIVGPNCRRSCCFTKAYAHYVEGTGSVFCPESKEVIDEVFKTSQNNQNSDEQLELLRSLKLRYFTPLEVARLMCFPDEFSFPEDTTIKQGYRLLGNSVNVHVVTLLILVLSAGDLDT